MKNIVRLLLLMLALSVALIGVCSCSYIPNFRNPETPDDPADPEAPGTPAEDNGDRDEGDGAVDEGNSDNSGKGGFRMKAKITGFGSRVEVDVIEAPYTSGVHWVITNENTDIKDENGAKIARSDLAVGDVVEIEYNGQVMMSYPPQIAALSIKVLSRGEG